MSKAWALAIALLPGIAAAADWAASASDQVKASASSDRKGWACLDYDFSGVSGYAVLRRPMPTDWPADFVLRTQVRGRGGANALQLKFVDASGDNVWWLNKPGYQPSSAPQPLAIKRRQIDFAWGPTADKVLRRTEWLELVVASTGPGATGGAGQVCIAEPTLTPRPPVTTAPPLPRISGDGAALKIDLGRERDFNGLLLRWAVAPSKIAVSASDDGRRWRPLASQPTGPVSALWLPDTSARWLRIDGKGTGMQLAALSLPSPEPGGDANWPDRNAMLAALAKELPRGTLPRAFLGQQNYWTVVGVDGGAEHSALISEDGAIEIGRGGASVEPQIRLADGRWLNWGNAAIGQTLADGDLPVPSAHLAWPGLQLDVTTAADGPPRAPHLIARYTLRNTGTQPLGLGWGLVLRPWQVNPPQQFLTTPGGVSEMRSLQWQGGQLAANGRTMLRPLFTPDAVRALPFAQGLSLDTLAAAPSLASLDDPQSLASAWLGKTLTLAPGESRGFSVLLALSPDAALDPKLDAEAAIDGIAATWRQRLGRVQVQLPPGNEALAQTLRTALAQLLVSREGPALRPGTRSYGRSWIRDGAMMVAALVRVGELDAARDFVDWFEPQIFASGKVPCCIDVHGADPVTENDSHGEYLYAVAEVWRASRDTAWLARHWPRVQSVLRYMDSLRAQTLADPQTPPHTPQNARGLMPPSISHEGYSDKAAYAFWDNFWALRGYKDAVLIAQALGHADEAAAFTRSRDAFAADLAAAVRATAARFGMATLAGAADRGDSDPTSSTMALDPAQAQDLIPPALLATTFTRYAAESAARADGSRPAGDYTPYELRNVGALPRLGRAEEAQSLLKFFFADQRPAAWRQWAEVVGREPRQPRFIGDMPHAWVASDFLRSALDLFAYTREADDAVVIGAGLTPQWRSAPLVGIQGLMLPQGRLDWRLLRHLSGWTLDISHPPERGASLVLAWPGDDPLPVARTPEGQVLPWQGRELRLPARADRIELSGVLKT